MIVHGYAAIWHFGTKRDGSDAFYVYLADSLRRAEGVVAAELFDLRIGHTNDGTLELWNDAIGLAFTLHSTSSWPIRHGHSCPTWRRQTPTNAVLGVLTNYH